MRISFRRGIRPFWLALTLALVAPASYAQPLPDRPITDLKLQPTGTNTYKLTPGRYRLTAQLQLDQLLKTLPAGAAIDASAVVILGSKSYKARAIGETEVLPPGLPRTVTSAGKTYDVLVIPVDADLGKVLAVGDTDFGCSSSSKLSIYESLQGHVDDWHRMDCTRYPAKGFWTSQTATNSVIGTTSTGASIYQSLIDCPPELSGCVATTGTKLAFGGFPANDWAYQYGDAELTAGKVALKFTGYAPDTNNVSVIIRGYPQTIRPGEYIVDPANDRIFIVPSTPTAGSILPSFEIPLILSNPGDVPTLVSIYGQVLHQVKQLAANITIDGLQLSFGTDNGLQLRAVSDLNLKNLRITHLSGKGIYGDRVASNDGYVFWAYNKSVSVTTSLFHDLGTGGLRLQGGDWPTLTPAGHAISQNVFSATNNLDRWGHGIDVTNVGSSVTDNLVFNLPGGGLGFPGNNHVIARNRFSCTNYEIADTGVVYSGRSWINRGSIVGGNIFDNNRGTTSRPMHWSGSSVQAVYLDDTLSGNAVLGNIQITGDRFTFMNGGSDNTYAGNIVVNPQQVTTLDTAAKKASRVPGTAFTYSASGCGMPDSWKTSFVKDYNDRAARPVWLAAYPEMARPLKFTTQACSGFFNTADDRAPHNNIFASNLLLSSAPKVDYFEGNPQVPPGAYAMFRNNWPFLVNTARNEPAWASNNAFARQPWTGTTPYVLPAIKAAVQSYMTQFPTTGVSSTTKTDQMLDKARTYLTGAADAYAANSKVWQRILGPRVNLERLPCDRVGD